MADDDLTAELDAMENRRAARVQYSLGFDPVDGSRLLAALRAVLELPAEWRQESEALRDAAGKVWEDAPDAPGIGLKHAYAAAYDDCAKALEAAITREITGKGESDERLEASEERRPPA